MANPVTVELLAPQVLSEAGTSAPVDIGVLRTVVCLSVTVSTVAGVVYLRLETSTDGIGNWREVDTKALGAGSLGRDEWTRAELDRHVRLAWTVVQGSVTVGVGGQAHVTYCDPGDFARFGLPPGTLEDVEPSTIVECCLTATDEADGYIGGAYTLPLVAWDRALRLHVAKIAVWRLMTRRGFDPESGPDGILKIDFDNAIAWLDRLQDGRLKPPGIIDSTP